MARVQSADRGPRADRRDPARLGLTPTSVHYWYRKRREVARLLIKHVPLAPSARIVEFGAGLGPDIPLLRELYPEADILALDASRRALRQLEERFGDVPRVRGQHADLRERLPIEDETVDLVHCSEVLEHIPGPELVLGEARRVIKPGGFLLITTPNEPNVFQKSFWRRRKPQGASTQSESEEGLYGHVALKRITEWERSLAEAGFELVDFARGAISYGGRRWLDREGVLAIYFAVEAMIDLAPRRLSRRLSDQLIGLYRRA